MSEASGAPLTGASRATMRDVAALAGVGIKTVSRVINDEPNVTAATIAKVKAAAERLDYHPDLNAGNLRRTGRKTRTLGLVVGSVANPFSGAIHRGVEDTAAARGVAVFASSLDDDATREERILTEMLRRRVDALILTTVRKNQSSLVAGTDARNRSRLRRPRTRRNRSRHRRDQQRRGRRRGDGSPHRRRASQDRLPRRPARTVDRAGAQARLSRAARHGRHPDPRHRRSSRSCIRKTRPTKLRSRSCAAVTARPPSSRARTSSPSVSCARFASSTSSAR